MFNRSISPEFIAALNAEYERKGWWQSLRDNQKLFVALRDGYVDVYHCGCAIIKNLTLSKGKLSASTHAKFLVDTSEGAYMEHCCGVVDTSKAIPLYRNLGGNIESIMGNARAFAGEEKAGVHDIIKQYPNIIDVEITFPGNLSERIDFVAIKQGPQGAMLVFYEAKAYSNTQALRAGGDNLPKIVEQLARYETVLTSRKSELEQAYARTMACLLQLEGLPAATRAVLQSCPAPSVDTSPRLVIFGFDEPQRTWFTQAPASRNSAGHSHYQKLVNALGKDRIIMAGEAGKISL